MLRNGVFCFIAFPLTATPLVAETLTVPIMGTTDCETLRLPNPEHIIRRTRLADIDGRDVGLRQIKAGMA